MVVMNVSRKSATKRRWCQGEDEAPETLPDVGTDTRRCFLQLLPDLQHG